MMRKLGSRTSGGIHVQLFCHRGDRRGSVAITGTEAGQAFELALHGHTKRSTSSTPYAYAGPSDERATPGKRVLTI
jgi:hypothetical protein